MITKIDQCGPQYPNPNGRCTINDIKKCIFGYVEPKVRGRYNLNKKHLKNTEPISWRDKYTTNPN